MCSATRQLARCSVSCRFNSAIPQLTIPLFLWFGQFDECGRTTACLRMATSQDFPIAHTVSTLMPSDCNVQLTPTGSTYLHLSARQSKSEPQRIHMSGAMTYRPNSIPQNQLDSSTKVRERRLHPRTPASCEVFPHLSDVLFGNLPAPLGRNFPAPTALTSEGRMCQVPLLSRSI